MLADTTVKKYLLIVFVMFLVLTACSAFRETLMYSSFSNFKVQELSTNPVMLKLSGASMNSALVVSEIRQVYNEETLDIYVDGRLVDDSGYGIAELNLVVVVPDYVTKVRFGKENKVIWKRAFK